MFSQVKAYHIRHTMADRLDDRARRARLVAQLYQMPDDVPDTEVQRPEKARAQYGGLLPMNPILVSGFFLAVASIACVFLWMQQSKPDITSNTLLVRAEAWDTPAAHESAPRVIRQIVKIATRDKTLKHTIYRDVQGKRKAKEERLTGGEDLLRRRLAEAYVSWDAPLSATSYQDWHDGQRVRADQIQRSPGHLLVLTTTTPNGVVAAQSLTVRDTDFHPVRRTVLFRDKETVEIAELDYSVLPWTPAASSLFQSEEEMRADGLTRPQPPRGPIPPPLLTEEQLDEAELSTRLTLNRLHADTGEQIEVARGSHGVEVRGITDTKERKHELEAELHMLPHVAASITSIEEMKAKPSEPGELSGVQVMEMQTRATPLETYYLAHGRNVAPLGDLAQRLFNSAFAINLESRAIDDLQQRFSERDGISSVASATLTDLLFTHKHKLLASIADEEQLLAKAQIEVSHSKQDTSTHDAGVPLANPGRAEPCTYQGTGAGQGRKQPICGKRSPRNSLHPWTS